MDHFFILQVLIECGLEITVLCKSNANEIRDISAKFERYLVQNEISSIF